MSRDRRFRRFAGGTFMGVGVLGASSAALLGVTHPAAAAALLAAAQTAVTCATTGTTPCASWSNTSSGIAVLGASTTGTGLRGTSNTNNGVKGSSKTSYGVLGTSTSGVGVGGTAPSNGVFGSATSANGIGVLGVVKPGLFGLGVDGEAASGIGVSGQSTTGIGVNAATASGFAVEAAAGSGVGLLAGNSSNTPGNAAVVAAGANYALQGDSDGWPLILTNLAGHVVFSVDAHGNVAYDGTIHNLARTVGGARAMAFSPAMTLPTMEDLGTGQLVGGAAAIRLDPTFAASIDAQTGYRVFLTPKGDSRGLFVAAKTPTGFVVRESQGGRTTVGFDYRVVATALGQTGQRMAIMPAAPPRIPVPDFSKLKPLRTPARPELPQP